MEIIPEYRLAQVQARDMDVAIRYGMKLLVGVQTHLLYPDLAIPAAAPTRIGAGRMFRTGFDEADTAD